MLVSWSWEWASCTIFSRAVVDRYENVRITCEYYNAELYDSLGSGLDALMSNIG